MSQQKQERQAFTSCEVSAAAVSRFPEVSLGLINVWPNSKAQSV